MQSHLEAALLGQGNNINNGVDDDEKDEPDEEIEEVDDFIDEVFKVNDCDGESPQKFNKIVGGSTTSGKVVTLQMLLSADILEPGKGVMTIEYLGQRFIGDLLADGKIQSQETDIIFASPSAWAVACKRFINPVKKSGCGWSSVKYRGRKLDVYKNIWYKKKKDLEDQQLREEQFEEEAIIMENIIDVNKNKTTAPYAQQIVVKHNTIANRTFTHDANTMIECVPFSNLGKIQPFLVSLSTSAALLMDFHCHLTKSEVSGYLAGQWDVNAHNLQITRAFPCRNTKADRENGPMVEAEISKTIDKEKLTLVGWYHSHPMTTAAPTLRDVDAQLDYQIRMKGTSDNGYTPCIGFIVSPYNPDTPTLESNIVAYWVIPPPENKPNEYGRPMAMSYSVTQDTTLALSLKEEMEKAVVYYDQQQDNCEVVKFSEVFTAIGTTTYIDKLKSSLLPKFPRDQSDTILWGYVRELLGCKVEEESVLSIPTVTKSSQILTPVSISPNLMLTSDIANALFSSGKFPNASSLLGLPDPMAHSTLAANNMFLSTNLFKMQELLKPLSASSPICSTKSKQDAHSPKPLKIPTDLKQPSGGIDFSKLPKMDYSHELNLMATASLKNKFDYLTATATTTESSVAVGKSFSAADLSISSSKTSSMGEFSLDLSRKDDGGERSLKMPKTDYFGLDMSTYSNKTEPLFNASNFSSDLSMNASASEDNSAYKSSDQPMNLTS